MSTVNISGTDYPLVQSWNFGRASDARTFASGLRFACRQCGSDPRVIVWRAKLVPPNRGWEVLWIERS